MTRPLALLLGARQLALLGSGSKGGPLDGARAGQAAASPGAAARGASTTTTTQTRAFSAESPLPSPSDGVVEMREYRLLPSGAADYMRLTNANAAVRRELLPLVGFFLPDLGGDHLTTATHFYSYEGGLDARARTRATAAADPRWQKYVGESRAHVASQRNAALVEWPSLYGASGGTWGSAAEYAALQEQRRQQEQEQQDRGQASASSPPPAAAAVYEMRTYRLSATASIRQLVRAFEGGLPAKAAAARRELGDGAPGASGELALFGSVEVGDLDAVVELWRYPSAGACVAARRAARLAPRWKDAVRSVAAGVSQFKVRLMVAAPLSPMR